MSACKHEELALKPSPWAKVAGYKQLTQRQLSEAAQIDEITTETTKRNKAVRTTTFPAPLVLPWDELSWNPDYEAQTVNDCAKDRNRVTEQRRVVYIVPTPTISNAVKNVRDWSKPQMKPSGKKQGANKSYDNATADAPARNPDVLSIKAEDVRRYLEAFYHPLPVKVLQNPSLSFQPWEWLTKPRGAQSRPYIGLQIGMELLGIRHRRSKDGIFSGQLNLNDLLDAAMAILPEDAYALLMIVDHDLYEDEEDDFCCGRAYGGSRVAVVSSARYNPLLDEVQKIEREHAWPVSHCAEYVEACCREADYDQTALPPPKKKRKPHAAATKSRSTLAQDSALAAAVLGWESHPRPSHSLSPHPSAKALHNLWFSRVCKTASHELGHCFGIDHCVYYACIMQGTAGLSEDTRQPPYLCPVDLVKITSNTGADAKERYQKLLDFSETWGENEGGEMWAAWAGWLRVRISELE